ncbi:hypothetical protein PUN28_011323 [Cardiocondyla obscurior]|uniref:Uncharacterized protein n=1 Tax=Cardiocondyla obscurior TaxID=286306 RepID=A0AAW2FH16_9HYME
MRGKERDDGRERERKKERPEPPRDEVEGERAKERALKEGAKGRKREGARARRERTGSLARSLARDATNLRRTTRLGYVGGAVIQPNAQVCRRLAGASPECRPPVPSLLLPPFSSCLPRRSGRVPPGCPPASLGPPPRSGRSSPPRPELPAGPRRGTATSPLPSPITARKRKCERTEVRVCV